MPDPTLKDYRIRITREGTKTYITRRRGDVTYISAAEIPLSLSNLLWEQAAETRFMLEDCAEGKDALNIVRMTLQTLWQKNLDAKPQAVLI